MNCAKCNNPLGTHYQLNRVDMAGKSVNTVSVCSLICLVSWAYTYGAQRGAMGVMMMKHMAGQALSALRGAPTKR